MIYSKGLNIPIMIAVLVLLLLSSVAKGDAADPCYNSAPGSICGQHGRLKHPQHVMGYANFTGIVSLRDCFDVAFQMNRQALLYSESEAKCTLIYIFNDNDRFVPDASEKGSVYYESSCFDCLAQCPTSDSTNLLKNGGFEKKESPTRDILPWIPLNSVEPLVAGHDSKHAVQLAAGNNTEGYGEYTLSQRFFPQCNTSFWRVLVDYRFDMLGPLGGNFSVICGSTILTVNMEGNVTNDWATLEGLYLFGEDITVPGTGVGLQLDPDLGAARVSVDNAKAYAVSHKIHANHTAPNLLVNGGFETGSIAPWTVQDIDPPQKPLYKVKQPGANGTAYAFYFTESKKHKAALYEATLSQDMATVAGQTYVLSFSLGVSESQECQFGPTALINIVSNGVTNFHGYGPFNGYMPPLAKPGTYTHHVYPFVATGNSTSLQFQLDAESENYGGTPCTILLDEISVVKAAD